ncbi:hypothetical protein ACI7RC_26160 [Brevibacillus sp. B_LB10_24]|uniref:hypothetical protein n=1 Tax=Brevibacillus TaxID=55080 RepID=UPI0003773F6C|nr:hypothetical protein [Brevibacillus massiliensis]
MRFVGIDPSTRTGFVAISEWGDVLRANELTGVGSQDPKRMASLLGEVMAFVKPDDIVCIEGFAFGAQGQGVSVQYGIGWGLRVALFRRGIAYTEVSPASVKKFATGKGNAKKDEMVLPIFKKWGFEHSSDNVRDAFVLAQIARELKFSQEVGEPTTTIKYEAEVIQSILNPSEKKKRKKVAK